MHFYAFGDKPTHDTKKALHQAALHASKKKRMEVAKRMFQMRFGDDVDVAKEKYNSLRGIEGNRIKALYVKLGRQYGVPWKGRNYAKDNWDLADPINKAVSAANGCLYALTTAIVCSMGYLAQLGFIHTTEQIAFVYDIADIYKPETTLVAAFQALGINPDAEEEAVITTLKFKIEERRLLKRIPKDIETLLKFD
jgi:CRISPR-associated protein Cas1